MRDAAYRLIPALAIGLLILLITVFGYALVKNLQVMGRWLERPYLFVFPAIGALAAIQLALSIRRRDDRRPFTMVALIFAAAFGTLAISFWPYMIPFSITVADAAAPHASLAFMFWGEGLFVFPLMLVYAVISYRVFRGRFPRHQATTEELLTRIGLFIPCFIDAFAPEVGIATSERLERIRPGRHLSARSDLLCPAEGQCPRGSVSPPRRDRNWSNRKPARSHRENAAMTVPRIAKLGNDPRERVFSALLCLRLCVERERAARHLDERLPSSSGEAAGTTAMGAEQKSMRHTTLVPVPRR